jgi:uncharacterized protein (DUF2267 family)
MGPGELLQRISERAGLEGPAEAERTARAVLGVVGERLSWAAADGLAADLPPALGDAVRAARHGQDFELDELHARVARCEGVRAGFAVEHAAVVCQAVALLLSDGALYRLRQALPASIGGLFTRPEPPARFEHVHLDPARGTLAEGRPGSQHPLAEARPERAHSHSVVRTDNPHGDTKLSSATGLTQEREQETLATGRPGGGRPPDGSD